MSGWDSSSRPTWDPQGGDGDSTQAFGLPDFANSPDGWGEPGEPPDIFRQDYTSQDLGRQDFSARDRAGDRRGDSGYWGRAPQSRSSQDYAPQDFPAPDFSQQDFSQQDFSQQDFSQQDFGRPDFTQQDFGRRDHTQSAYPQQDFAQQDYAQQDYAQQDRSRRGSPRGFRDRPDADPDLDFADPGYQDPDYAARNDPALRDFFAPQGARPDAATQRYGPRSTRSPGAGQGPGEGPARRSAQQGGPGPGRAAQQADSWNDPLESWDVPSFRQAPTRSARRREYQPRRRGGNTTIGIVVGVVVVLGIVIGVIALTHHNSSSPPTATPTSSPTASKDTRAGTTTQGAAADDGYTLTAPSVAGGYQKIPAVSTAVQTAASTTAEAVRSDALTAGGKVTTGVSAAYQLDGGQVLAFTGFEGTFDPAKVMTALASLGSDEGSYPAGSHGGDLACATAPATSTAQSGTVCVWATTTTIGVTEFFSPDGPEIVTNQAKAASDTLNVRDSVEVAKTA